MVRENKPPVYPKEAIRAEAQGTVVMRLRVGIDGKVMQSRVLVSSGHKALDKAAQDAVTTWRYLPGKKSDEPEAMSFDIPFTLKLE